MDTLVGTTAGAVRGVGDGAVSRFLGIPYAAPPSETGWLLPAQPVPPWSGIREATEFGPTVPKSPYPWPSNELLAEPDRPGDDCLNLNVWTPDVTGSAPVFVWIHGGAFRNGSGSVPQYDGTAFARDGVVCVTVNYRLGAYGFLDTGDELTNIGLRDQIAALNWVRDNISAFGGDPARVTIGGESAGGMSVGALLSSPKAAGLFRAAVLQSGAAHHALSRPAARFVTGQLADILGIEPTREAFARVPIKELLLGQDKLGQLIQTDPDRARWGEVALNQMAFEPVVDADVLPALPIASIRDGSAAGVRVLVGSNTDEMLYFLAPSGMLDLLDAAGESVVLAGAAGYGLPEPVRAAQIYRAASPGLTAAAVATDWFFRIPAIRLAEAATTAYVYEFGWRSTARDGILGACHALEIAFVFDTLAADGTQWLAGPDAPQELADEMHAAWVRFIVDGDPGWAPYTADDRVVRMFGTGTRLEHDPRSEQRRLWDGVR